MSLQKHFKSLIMFHFDDVSWFMLIRQKQYWPSLSVQREVSTVPHPNAFSYLPCSTYWLVSQYLRNFLSLLRHSGTKVGMPKSSV